MITIRINIVAEEVNELMMYVKIGIIDVRNGMKYRKEFMRTAIDIRKLFNGGGMMSFVGRTLLSGLADAADFELKFPLKKVKHAYNFFSQLLSFNFSNNKGVLNINNFTITDQFASFLASKNVALDLRFTGTVKKNSKAMVFLVHAEGSGMVL